MNLTLLVENNPEIVNFYKLNLLTWLDQETIVKNKGSEVLDLLNTPLAKELKLIIVRSRIENEQSAKIVIERIGQLKLKIPIIVIGTGDFGTFQVTNSLDIKKLIKTSAQALNITAKEMSTKVVPDFFPIPISFFQMIKRPICDVYGTEAQSGLFKLELSANKDLDQSTIKTLIALGIKNLFVKKLNRLDFVNNLTSEIISKLELEDLNEDEKITATNQNIELLTQKVISIGINEDTVRLAKKNIESLRKNIKMNPALSKLLDQLYRNKTSYLFLHSQILCFVATHIIKHIEWGNPEQEEKICFVALFHDIFLENDQQGKIHTPNQLRQAGLTDEKKSLVERHAQLAAELVAKFPRAPMGADQIIRQHHGQLNGTGFSEHYGAVVSPPSVVFILSEEFTRLILKQDPDKVNKSELIRELKEQFPTSRFSKIIEKLETLLI